MNLSSSNPKPKNLSFGIANFKAFGPKLQSINLRPLTLVFGPNSAGKSSLIHSLLWAKEVLTTHNPDVRKINATQGQVDLGGFVQTRFKGAKTEDIEFKVHIAANLNATFSFGTDPAPPHLGRIAALISSSLIAEAEEKSTSEIEAAARLVLRFNASRALGQFWPHIGGASVTVYEKRKCGNLQRMVFKVCPNIYKIWKQHPSLATELGTNKLKAGAMEYEEKISSLDPSLMIPAIRRCNVDLRTLKNELAAFYLMFARRFKIEEPAIKELIDPRLTKIRIEESGSVLLTATLMRDGQFWVTFIDPRLLSTESELKQIPKLLPNFIKLVCVNGRPKAIEVDNEAYQLFGAAFARFLKVDFQKPAVTTIDLAKLNDLLEEVASRELLPAIEYVGPLRYIPERQNSNTTISSHENESSQSAWGRLTSNEKLRREVNDWIGFNHLKLGYQLRVDHQVELGSVERIVKEQLIREFQRIKEEAELVPESVALTTTYLNLDPIGRNRTGKTQYNTRTWHSTGGVREFEDGKDFLEMLDEPGAIDRLTACLRAAHASPATAVIRLKDLKSGADVALQDVGVGISQILPLLLHSIGNENALLAVEQPEIHVHPALQAELGDLFIHSATTKGNTLILETHSEHLILRIMRRMRETFEGKLPDGLPPLTPDDVCILYVEPGDNGSIVREMPLNERGELIKGWPGGFFEEALNEMF